MRMILATASLVLLAACGGGASNNAAGNANEIRECVDDVRNELPAGTDVNAFCGCAVGKMTSGGLGERPAMEQCAAEMGIQPRR